MGGVLPVLNEPTSENIERRDVAARYDFEADEYVTGEPQEYDELLTVKQMRQKILLPDPDGPEGTLVEQWTEWQDIAFIRSMYNEPQPEPTHRHKVTLDEFKRLLILVREDAFRVLRALAETDDKVLNLFEWLEAKQDPLDLKSEDANIWFAYMVDEVRDPDGNPFLTAEQAEFVARGVPLSAPE